MTDDTNSLCRAHSWTCPDTVRREVGIGYPTEIRTRWSSGGGHMHVMYGYDTERNWVYRGDLWVTNNRHHWDDFDYYVNGSSFPWTHSPYWRGALRP